MLPRAERYLRFYENVFHGAEERHLPSWEEPITEMDLQSLWFGGEFGSSFVTTDGRRFLVRDFGVWNHSAGPDFVGCSLQLDGKTLKGDIELDPDLRDWERHGHGGNASYEQVILHVFARAPEDQQVFTRTSQHREVMQVQIRPDMLKAGAQARPIAEARLGRCAHPLAHMSGSALDSLLEGAAQYRLQKKGERIAAVIRAHGREQAIFQCLAGALGYRHNQRAFTVLTQRLPLRGLLREKALEREALLFGCAGFLDSVKYEDTEGETRTYLRELWSEWWKVRSAYTHWLEEDQRIRWQIAGARPGNHPQRRLGALSAILQNWKILVAPMQDAALWSEVTFAQLWSDLAHPFWSHHYTLMAAPSTRPIALVGASRVREILANVCYPLLVPERPELWAEYLKLPAVLDNQKVRRAALRLFGETPAAAKFPKRLFHQQGLLQVYEDYCLEDDSSCAECSFPDKLHEWKA